MIHFSVLAGITPLARAGDFALAGRRLRHPTHCRHLHRISCIETSDRNYTSTGRGMDGRTIAERTVEVRGA